MGLLFKNSLSISGKSAYSWRLGMPYGLGSLRSYSSSENFETKFQRPTTFTAPFLGRPECGYHTSSEVRPHSRVRSPEIAKMLSGAQFSQRRRKLSYSLRFRHFALAKQHNFGHLRGEFGTGFRNRRSSGTAGLDLYSQGHPGKSLNAAK